MSNVLQDTIYLSSCGSYPTSMPQATLLIVQYLGKVPHGGHLLAGNQRWLSPSRVALASITVQCQIRI